MKKQILTGIILSFSFIFSRAQNVGIGTTDPKARLHVADSAVVFNAEGQVPATQADPPVTGVGRRFMWYADKAAFRAGYSATVTWNKENIGNYSFVGGFNGMASGLASTAFGVNTIASNNFAFAVNNTTTASGWAATAMGFGTVSASAAETVIGSYNTQYTPLNVNFINAADRLFVVGNGTSDLNRRDAFTILKNGNTGMGTNSPAARLHVADSNVLFSATGFASGSPGEAPVTGSGRRMMWYADKGAFRAGYSNTDGWDRIKTGNYSFAAGYGTIAAGEYSTALGINNSAYGTGAMALGASSSAQGWYSVASGNMLTAHSMFETVIGSYNSNYTPAGGNNAWISSDRLFVVANGISDAGRSNALTVLKNGRTGIGTPTPAARLHVTDSSVVFSATGSITLTPADPPVSGTGRRMMWYADKAAFRAGYALSENWDKQNIGNYSVAMGGAYTIASGECAIALGTYARALGDYSLAVNASTWAMGNNSVAMGNLNEAMGDVSFTMGEHITARSYNSVAMGRYNDTIAGSNTTAWVDTDPVLTIGNGQSGARKNALTVFKNGNTDVNGYLRIGRTASGNADFSGLETGWGVSGKQADAGKIQYGGFGGNAHWLNIIGGGSSPTGNDRFIKFWCDGGMRIRGNTFPDVDNGYSLGQSGARWSAVWSANGVIQTSDARLKTKISSLNYGLKELLQMQPVQYNWKTNPDDKKEIGFLAQDMQKIIPEAVEVPANGDAMGMKYTELIPVLVKAIQEQQKEIDELKRLLKEKNL